MKIAIITPGTLPIPPVLGGAVENLLYSFLKENEKKNALTIDVFGSSSDYSISREFKNTRFIFSEITVLTIPMNLSVCKKVVNLYNEHKYISNVALKVKNGNYDVVLIENRPSFVKRIRKNFDGKLVLHLHNSHIIPRSRKKEVIVSQCDAIIAVSIFLQTEVQNAYPEYSSKIHFVHNAIDSDVFRPIENHERLQKLRESLKINNDDFVIGYSGRLVPEKGVLELILAFKSCMRDIKNLKLLVIGSSWYGGENSSNKYSRFLINESSGYEEYIKFTGYVKNELIPEYLSLANLMVYPSVWNEPFGLAILESLGIGLTTVANSVGGIPEIYMHMPSKTKMYLLNIGNKNDLSERIKSKVLYVYKNGGLSECDKNSQISIIQKEFSMEVYHEKMILLINQIYNEK